MHRSGRVGPDRAPFPGHQAPGDPAARRALLAASCHEPKKLMPQLQALTALAAQLDRLEIFVDVPWSEVAFVSAAMAAILGNRGPVQLARMPDERLGNYFEHLLRKRRTTQGDLLKLHALLAPEATPGLRRNYVKIDGVDASTATYVPPPPLKVSGYFKDLIEFVNADAKYVRLGLVRSVVTAAQMILVHPFSDGNGRMSRAIFFLVAHKSPSADRVMSMGERLWCNGNELMYAICNNVIDGGWSGNDLPRLLKQLIEERRLTKNDLPDGVHE